MSVRNDFPESVLHLNYSYPESPFLNNSKKRLAVFYQFSVFYKNFCNCTGTFTLNLIHKFHRFCDSDNLSDFDLVTNLDKTRCILCRCSVESSTKGEMIRLRFWFFFKIFFRICILRTSGYSHVLWKNSCLKSPPGKFLSAE